jgi:hypothetical protein
MVAEISNGYRVWVVSGDHVEFCGFNTFIDSSDFDLEGKRLSWPRLDEKASADTPRSNIAPRNMSPLMPQAGS